MSTTIAMVAGGYNFILYPFQTNKALVVDGLSRALFELSVIGWWAVLIEEPFSDVCEAKTVDAGDTDEKKGEEKG